MCERLMQTCFSPTENDRLIIRTNYEFLRRIKLKGTMSLSKRIEGVNVVKDFRPWVSEVLKARL